MAMTLRYKEDSSRTFGMTFLKFGMTFLRLEQYIETSERHIVSVILSEAAGVVEESPK
jgi:hypothetical protein